MTVSQSRFRNTDLSLSRFIAGCWRLTNWNKTTVELDRWIRSCVDLGVTTFDLADIYGRGQCHAAFGQAFDPKIRGEVQLISKCGICPPGGVDPVTRIKHYNTSGAYVVARVEDSLRALRTDRLDLLLLHRPDPLLDVGEVASAFQLLESSGKVRYFGVSNFMPSQVELLACGVAQPLVANQIQIHLGHLDPLFDGSLDQLQRLGMLPMAWSPLGGGAVFSGTGATWQRIQRALDGVATRLSSTREQVALAWLLRHPARILPILGTGNVERMRSQAAAERLVLDREDWFELLEAARGEPVP
jgi:predicted oxidoreductase